MIRPIRGPGSTSEIIESYTALHARGLAHSVEAWREDRLVGGLYGVSLRGAFFGESMFHRETDASKIALIALVERLVSRGYMLLDTQWMTPHLEQFGATEIPREEYLRRLERACGWRPPSRERGRARSALVDGVGFAERERGDARVELFAERP